MCLNGYCGMFPLTMNPFFRKLGRLVDPETNEAKIEGGRITFDFGEPAELYGELANRLSMKFPMRPRRVVVPLSKDDVVFAKALSSKLSGAKFLTEEELVNFSKPKGMSVILVSLSVTDEIMEDVAKFVALLKHRKVVLIDYYIGTVIDECKKARELEVVNLFDRGDYLS